MEGGIPMTQCKQPWWVENEERDERKRKAKDDEIDRLKQMVGKLESENANLRDIIENCGVDADELLGEE